VQADHDRRDIIVEPTRAGHRNRVTSDIIDYEHSNSTCCFGVRDFLAKGARPTINNRKLARRSGETGAPVGTRVEKVVGTCGQGREVAHSSTYGRTAARRICKWLADEVLICTGASGDHIRATTGRLHRLSSRTGVAGRHRDDYSNIG